MANNFDRAVREILETEGVLSDSARDKGGLTKYGISKNAYPNLDIAKLTVNDAIQIYRKDFWDACQCDTLPPGLDLQVFDCAVNQGAGTAVKFLQQAAGVPADGKIGPMTLAAVKGNPPKVLREFCVLRAWRYEINPAEDEFGKGWFRRLFGHYDMANDWLRGL